MRGEKLWSPGGEEERSEVWMCGPAAAPTCNDPPVISAQRVLQSKHLKNKQRAEQRGMGLSLFGSHVAEQTEQTFCLVGHNRFCNVTEGDQSRSRRMECFGIMGCEDALMSI